MDGASANGGGWSLRPPKAVTGGAGGSVRTGSGLLREGGSARWLCQLLWPGRQPLSMPTSERVFDFPEGAVGSFGLQFPSQLERPAQLEQCAGVEPGESCLYRGSRHQSHHPEGLVEGTVWGLGWHSEAQTSRTRRQARSRQGPNGLGTFVAFVSRLVESAYSLNSKMLLAPFRCILKISIIHACALRFRGKN